MKRKNLFSRLGSMMLVVVLVMTSLTSHVFAAQGTPAGTSITNQATVTFKAGTNDRTVTSTATTIYVAVKNVIQLTNATSTGNAVDGTTIYRTFVIKNDGNYKDAYTLAVQNVPTGWSAAIYQDNAPVGTYTTADIATASTGDLAVDGTYNVIVAITIPIGAQAADGSSYDTRIGVTSTAANIPASNIVVSNPGHSVTHTATVTIAKPVLTFGVTAVEPSPKIPGANFSFNLTVQNTGTGNVVGTSTITYTLPPQFEYVSSTWSPAPTYTAGVSGYSGGTLTLTLTDAQLAANGPVNTIPFVVRIEQTSHDQTGPTAGTSITSAATDFSLQYTDGAVPVVAKTQAPTSQSGFAGTFGVASASGLTLSVVAPAAQSGDPDGVLEYHVQLKNTGNHSDQFDLSHAQVAGTLDAAHIFVATSGGSTSISSISGVAQGATVDVYVRVTIPADAADAATIGRNLTAVTHTASAVPPTGGQTTQTVVVTSTVTAPNLAVAIAPPVLKTGTGSATNPAPGDVIEYTVSITNSGTGTATSLSSSNAGQGGTGGTNMLDGSGVDLGPDGSTFAAVGQAAGGSSTSGSITMNVQTYNVAAGTITVTVPSLPTGKTVLYRYRVVIK